MIELDSTALIPGPTQARACMSVRINNHTLPTTTNASRIFTSPVPDSFAASNYVAFDIDMHGIAHFGTNTVTVEYATNCTGAPAVMVDHIDMQLAMQ